MFVSDDLSADLGASRSQQDTWRLTRRGFVGAATGAFAIGLPLWSRRAFAEEDDGTLKNAPGGDATPSLFVTIRPDGTVEVTNHRSEMGQQVTTAMAQIIADELDADWSRVTVVQAEGHPRYGSQNTDGSRSVRNNFERLRITGAAMRRMLEQAAARHWKVDRSTCSAVLHEVVHEPSGRRLGYGALASAAAKVDLPPLKAVPLKPRSRWRYIGQPTPSLTVPQIVRGQGTFGIDVRLPDMLHAVVARPPQVLGYVERVDDRKAREVPGVVTTVELPKLDAPAAFKPLGGVAVVGETTWAAIQGRRALEIVWAAGPNAEYDSAVFEQAMFQTARKPGEVRRDRGDVTAALEAAAKRVEAEYYVPHLSQSPMEPPSATAHWTGDTVECWGCTQTPQAARKTVADVCGIPVDSVKVNVTWLGGGFGRKSKPDFLVEAALIARAVQKPVKVTWTREDDLQHGYLHTVSAQRLEAGLDERGDCTAWLHRTVFPPISSTFNAAAENPSWGELQLGASDTPFAIGNLRLESGPAKGHVRIGWLRSVANIYHAFAVQSFVAELAAEADRDPKDYLLELIGPPRHIDPNTEGAKYENYGSPLDKYPIDTGRLAHVVEKAAEMAGWGQSLPAGHGRGIAVHRSFVTYVATVVEVSISDDGRIRIPGVWSAVDAGTVVNTRHTAAQIEGGTLYGLSNALYGEITAKNGVVEQANFPSWRLMRIHEAPRSFEVYIVPSDAPPGGVGEPATPPAAPALANAIFAATNVRLRRLPILGPKERLPSRSKRSA